MKLAVLGAESVDVEKLDLFSVSEIKMPKSGGIELKFYDRIKALEALGSLNRGTEDDSAPFIEAIVKGSAALERAARSDDDEF